MRYTLPLLTAAAATALVAGFLVLRTQEVAEPQQEQRALTPQTFDASESQAAASAARRIEDLTLELATLRTRVEQLERPSTRESAGEALAVEPQAVAGGAIPTSDERARILAVMEQIEQERDYQRDLKRDEKQLAENQRRAAKIADKLQLPTGSEERIASILLAEQEQVASVRVQFKDLGRGPEARKALKDALAETRTWRDEEFSRFFGFETAKAISEAEGGKQRDRKSSDERSGRRDKQSTKDERASD